MNISQNEETNQWIVQLKILKMEHEKDGKYRKDWQKNIVLLFMKLSIKGYNIIITGQAKSRYLSLPKIDKPSSRNWTSLWGGT